MLFNTPITYPIEWQSSKIPGSCRSCKLSRSYHGLTAFFVMSSVAARFFNPQVSGAWASRAGPGGIPHRPRREVQPNHAHTIPALEERARGSASIGASIADSLPVLRRASADSDRQQHVARRASTSASPVFGLNNTITGGLLTGPDQLFAGGFTATVCGTNPTCNRDCESSPVGISARQLPSGPYTSRKYRLRVPRMTTITRSGSSRAASLILPWARTTYSMEIVTSGVSVSRSST